MLGVIKIKQLLPIFFTIFASYLFAEDVEIMTFDKYKFKVGDAFLCNSRALVSIHYEGEVSEYNQETFGFKIIDNKQINFTKEYPAISLFPTSFPIIEMSDGRIEFGYGFSSGGRIYHNSSWIEFKAIAMEPTRTIILTAECENL